MLVAIYARLANEDDVIRQVENCRRYILKIMETGHFTQSLIGGI